MVTVDLARLDITAANELIRRHGEAGDDVEVVNSDARHHIGVGLTADVALRIRGSAGYFCAGLTDGPRVEVEGNVGWGLADNMLSGSVVVRGNAGAIAGVAIRGPEVVVHGNLGSRAGQVMKEGTLCCGGSANFMAGYMMYGGRLVICGDSGELLGQDIHGGSIYVGGRILSLGNDAMQTELEAGEEDGVLAFLDRYGLALHGKLKKVVNAGKNLRYPRTEPRVRVIPFFVGAERTAYWNEKVQEDISVKAQIGRYRIRGYGATRPLPHISDLAFRRDLTAVAPDPEVVSRVDLRTQIGDRFRATPIELSMPVMIAPMSYGALSKSTKIALAKASALSDICDNSGEGGLIPEVREAAKRVVVQILGGRLGWSIHAMRAADGLEIYISQGAKPGLGGQLMAKKVTEDIARLRGIPAGIDLRSPSRHPDVLGADDLVIKVEELREATGWEKPVSVKLGAGRVRDDIKIAYKDGFDYVCLDGLQGSTGAAGNEVIEHVGIPTLPAIMEALDALDEIGAQGMPIMLMGGIKDGIDVAKAIALGAHGAALGTSAIIAGGCIACLQCAVGQCVVGIATQDPVYEARYDIDVESWNIHRYLEAVRWQLATVLDAHGYRTPYELTRDDLVALTPEAAAITRLEYAPEHAANTLARVVA